MKDPNRIARIEKAISKKYGQEAVENPRKYWNEEKEKSYQDQIKKLAEKERSFEEKDDKVEQDGFLISKKLLNKDTTRRTCPVCEKYSFKIISSKKMKPTKKPRTMLPASPKYILALGLLKYKKIIITGSNINER